MRWKFWKRKKPEPKRITHTCNRTDSRVYAGNCEACQIALRMEMETSKLRLMETYSGDWGDWY